MNEQATNTVARSTLPLLITLVVARKQARWQWVNCAAEHEHVWSLVVEILDARIALGEEYLAKVLKMPGFRVKREIVE